MDITGLDSTNSLYSTETSGLSGANNQKLELSLALSANLKNQNTSLLNGLGNSYSSGSVGLGSSLLYKIYDNKAITPSILNDYYAKMKAALAQESEDATTTAVTDEQDAETVKSDDSKTSMASAVYQPQMSEGRGYDYESVRKLYEDMLNFYSKPENAFKVYQPPAESSLDVEG
ncbi:MAG: hypothetical protein A2293_03275 [Elusimicrobia bacterium RIFOXYB2_FULL_49_7]|nr:MAG: hypothetical protein A2293_03275 [Elusimicrobia bacterium RIFOXYB2_FULL_49_7]